MSLSHIIIILHTEQTIIILAAARCDVFIIETKIIHTCLVYNMIIIISSFYAGLCDVKKVERFKNLHTVYIIISI